MTKNDHVKFLVVWTTSAAPAYKCKVSVIFRLCKSAAVSDSLTYPCKMIMPCLLLHGLLV